MKKILLKKLMKKKGKTINYIIKKTTYFIQQKERNQNHAEQTNKNQNPIKFSKRLFDMVDGWEKKKLKDLIQVKFRHFLLIVIPLIKKTINNSSNKIDNSFVFCRN